MVGAHQNLDGSGDFTTPLSGMICHPRARTYYINLPTKFEVDISTHYNDMKGYTKCGKWCGLGPLMVPKNNVIR